jgi:hypothetical protein
LVDSNDAELFLRVCLLYSFERALQMLAHGESNVDWIQHMVENVVNANDLDVIGVLEDC